MINNQNRVKDLHDDELRFGDEIECGIFVIDSVNKTVKITIRSAEVENNNYNNAIYVYII